MALTPDTDQFSQFLRLAFLRSPNYIAGVSGWTVNIDGSVEFNNGTFRGVIVGGSRFIYNGTPALGNPPIASITSNTTDSFGNPVVKGICAYITVSSGTGAGRYAIDLGDQANPYAQFAALTFQNLTHLANLPPAMTGQVDSTLGAAIQIQSGKLAGGDSESQIQLTDSHATRASITLVADALTITPIGTSTGVQLTGTLALEDQASPPSSIIGGLVLFADSNGFLHWIPDSNSGDTTTYQAGLACFRNTTDQTGIGASATVISGLSATIGAGLYHIRGMVSIANPTGGTITPTVGFSGSGGLTTANLDVGLEWYSNTAGTFKGAGKVSTLGSGVAATSGQASGEVCYVKFDGIINVSAAGTFNVFAQGSGAGLTVKAYSRCVYHVAA